MAAVICAGGGHAFEDVGIKHGTRQWPAIRGPQPNVVGQRPACAKASEGTILRPPLALRAEDGGAEGVRTPDLLNAIQALYQLSYDPSRGDGKSRRSRENVKINFH